MSNEDGLALNRQYAHTRRSVLTFRSFVAIAKIRLGHAKYNILGLYR